MNRFSLLLCLATLATSAIAQETANRDFVSQDPSLAYEDRQTEAAVAKPSAARPSVQVVPPPAQESRADLQLRPAAPSVQSALMPTATVLRLKLSSPISTATARPGQQFAGTLTRPVEVDGRIVLPTGSSVTCQVERATSPRRFAGKPSLSIKATSARLDNGETITFSASVVDTGNPHHLDVDDEGRIRGTSPNPMNKVEMGALAGTGAIAGAVIAGPEGLLIGTASGALAAAGHIVIKHHDLTLPAGTELIFELDAPASPNHPQMGGMQ